MIGTWFFFPVKQYHIKLLEIIVPKGRTELTIVTVFDQISDELLDEEFLGDAFKSTEATKFLCDDWGSYITGVGQKFLGGVVDFRDKLKKYAIKGGLYYFFNRNDSRYVSIVCQDVECPFFVKGSLRSSDCAFYIKEYMLDHRCEVVRVRKSNELIRSQLVSACLQDDVLYNLAMKPNDMRNKFKLYYGYDISYKVALTARQKALGNLYGSEESSFNKLIWYRDCVMETNPGSIFELEIDPKTNRFVRLFIAFSACIVGFKRCLPVYLDGCFGKSSYKGQVIAATGKNGIYPVAVCVCESESEANWDFFLQNLKWVTDMHSRPVSFISDRGKGLLLAIEKIFPKNPHLYCYYHLKNNLRKRFLGKGSTAKVDAVEYKFFKCAYASSEKQFYHNLAKLRIEGGHKVIDQFLKDLHVESWCRAFGVGTRYGVMANSVADCFNNWVNLERAMPVCTLLEEVRIKQMELIGKRELESLKWRSPLTPEMEGELLIKMDKGRRLRDVRASQTVFEVRSKYSYMVYITLLRCSCMKWQINGFPYPHALTAITSVPGLDVYLFIDPLYSASNFWELYSSSITPVSNVEMDYYVQEVPNVAPPPVVQMQHGRRHKLRYKSALEKLSVKNFRVYGRCKKKSYHNCTTCKESLD